MGRASAAIGPPLRTAARASAAQHRAMAAGCDPSRAVLDRRPSQTVGLVSRAGSRASTGVPNRARRERGGGPRSGSGLQGPGGALGATGVREWRRSLRQRPQKPQWRWFTQLQRRWRWRRRAQLHGRWRPQLWWWRWRPQCFRRWSARLRRRRQRGRRWRRERLWRFRRRWRWRCRRRSPLKPGRYMAISKRWGCAIARAAPSSNSLRLTAMPEFCARRSRRSRSGACCGCCRAGSR